MDRGNRTSNAISFRSGPEQFLQATLSFFPTNTASPTSIRRPALLMRAGPLCVTTNDSYRQSQR